MVDAYRNRAYARGVQNKIQGYYQDQSVIDSLFAMGEEVMDGIDLDYFKSITDFSADFTSLDNAGKGKVQYIEQSIRMIAIYHPTLIDSKPVDRNQPAILNYNEIGVNLILENYDYAEIDEFTVAELKEKIDWAISVYPDSVKYEVLKSLVLSWLMEYDFALSILDSLNTESYLNDFIAGNYQYFIGSVKASLDIKQFRLDKSEGISILTQENETVNENFELAVDHYDRALMANPEFIYGYYNRAYLNAMLKNYDKAIVDYTRCIESGMEMPEALYNRGLLRVYLNQYTEGCADLSKAGEMGIDNAYRVIYKYCKNSD